MIGIEALPHAAEQDRDPDEQAKRKKNLPESSEIHKLPALMAKPVIHGQVRNEAIDRGPLTDEAADDDLPATRLRPVKEPDRATQPIRR